MSDTPRSARRRVQPPPALSTPNAVPGEEAPVEAVRAIAALLGRAALPGPKSRRAPATQPTTPSDAEQNDAAPPRGDREVLIAGSVATLSDEAYDAVRDTQKRTRRARKRVREVLERLSSEAPDALST